MIKYQKENRSQTHTDIHLVGKDFMYGHRVHLASNATRPYSTASCSGAAIPHRCSCWPDGHCSGVKGFEPRTSYWQSRQRLIEDFPSEGISLSNTSGQILLQPRPPSPHLCGRNGALKLAKNETLRLTLVTLHSSCSTLFLFSFNPCPLARTTSPLPFCCRITRPPAWYEDTKKCLRFYVVIGRTSVLYEDQNVNE
jgi:hypothetical protein